MPSKKQNIQHCKGCKYWRTLGMRGKTIAEAQFACHYLYDTAGVNNDGGSRQGHNVREAHVAAGVNNDGGSRQGHNVREAHVAAGVNNDGGSRQGHKASRRRSVAGRLRGCPPEKCTRKQREGQSPSRKK